MKRTTMFPIENNIEKAINIDENDSDEDSIDFDKYEVNMDMGDNQKRKYKRIYDSKYKIPIGKKIV